MFSLKKDVLLSKFNNANTNQQKKKVWTDIMASVNAHAGNVKRTVDEIKRSGKISFQRRKKMFQRKNAD